MLITWSDRNFEFYSDFNLVSSSYTQQGRDQNEYEKVEIEADS